MHARRLWFLGAAVVATTGACKHEEDTDDEPMDTTVPLDDCAAKCCPSSSCPAADLTCLGVVDNDGETTFGLRMSQITFTAPAAMAAGIVAGVFAGAATPNQPECNLQGAATFSWLLRFDTVAGTLETGGARPVSDPESGYTFVNESIDGLNVAPARFDGVVPDADGRLAVTQGVDLVVPVYLDAAGTQHMLLPLRDMKFPAATLSSHNNCIGAYNVDGLDPANACVGDNTNRTFVSGGQITAMMTLEDADSVVFAALNETICVLLSGDQATYGFRDVDGVTRCKRTGGAIDFQGDTCSTPGGGCRDAVSLSADFAASSVTIL